MSRYLQPFAALRDQIILTQSRKGAKWASLLEAVYDARYAIFDKRGSEIYEQSKARICQANIRQRLFLMHGHDLFHRLQFYDYFPLDIQINPKPFIERNSIIFYGDGNLPLNQ